MYLEPFSTYQDVKTKTLNWCSKMKDVGLLNADQVSECESSFKDVSSGILPKEFKPPSTGVSNEYSLYNTRIHALTPNIIEDTNTNNVMLVSNDGLYLGCKSDNTMYYVKNINDNKIIQKELYFTLIPQNENVYVVMSSYGKYLIVNPQSTSGDNSWSASFNGNSIGTIVSWTVTKIESSTNTKATFESIQYPNFFLSTLEYNSSIDSTTNSSSHTTSDLSNSTDVFNSLKILYGRDDTMVWQIISKPSSSQIDGELSSKITEYTVNSENLITNLKNNKIQSIFLNNMKNILTTLKDTVNNNYTNIEYFMQNQLTIQQNLYNTTSSNYNRSVDSINKSFFLNADSKQSIINSIPLPSGFNLTNVNIDIVLNNITNMKNQYNQQIQADIQNINTQLTTLSNSEKQINNDINKFNGDIDINLANTITKINDNNIIINRQQTDFDKFNNDYSYYLSKKEIVKTHDETAKINTNLISNNSNKNNSLVKIYPFLIISLIIVILYLLYITYQQFMINIYNVYKYQ